MMTGKDKIICYQRKVPERFSKDGGIKFQCALTHNNGAHRHTMQLKEINDHSIEEQKETIVNTTDRIG